MNTNKTTFSKNHYEKAIRKLTNPNHQKWIKTYFPFKEKEIALPAINTLDFSRRSWAEPIWQEYMNLCDEITKNSFSDQFRTGFYEFFGGPDYELINKIEEVFLEERAFPKQSQQKTKTTTKASSTQTIDEGWVYLLRKDNLHKIGETKDLFRRMRELKADNKGCELIDAVKCCNRRQLEKKLHKHFKEVRYPQSEWFNLNKYQIQEAQKLLKQSP